MKKFETEVVRSVQLKRKPTVKTQTRMDAKHAGGFCLLLRSKLGVFHLSMQRESQLLGFSILTMEIINDKNTIQLKRIV